MPLSGKLAEKKHFWIKVVVVVVPLLLGLFLNFIRKRLPLVVLIVEETEEKARVRTRPREDELLLVVEGMRSMMKDLFRKGVVVVGHK
jgi:hypothetical protein